ncbi:MAG: hypothetical protein QM496_20885 [Verrucomicrobiota bacterium]
MSTLTDSDIRNLPAPIVDKLRSLISRVRRLIFLRGLFATIAVGLISILIIMAIDASFTLFSDLARWSLSLCGLAFTLATAWHFLIRPLSRRITLTHIARILETRHPELQERISSAVELMRSDDPDSIRGSKELIDEVVNSAVIDVKDVSPESEFDNTKTQRFFYAAVTTAAIVLVLLMIWPRQTGILFARAIAPFLDIGNAYSNTLTVDPGDIRVPIGESVTVTMSIKNKNIRRVTLRRSADEKSKESVESMSLLESQADGTQSFTITFPAVAESFRYRINAGSAVSRYFNVEAVPLPEVENLTVRYEYPPYTGLEDQEVESQNGDISAVEHTQVTVVAHLNKAVTKADLSINDKLTPAEAILSKVKPQASWSFPLDPGLNGTWTLKLSDRNDFENTPVTYAIQALPDLAPAIVINAPQARDLKLKRSESLPIKYTIKEDFGFSALDLIVRRDGEAKPLEIPLDLPDPGVGELQSWHGNALLDIGSLKLSEQTRKLTVQIRVRDNLPPEYQGPHESLSDAITIILDANAQSLVKQAIEADRKEIEKALAEAKTDLTQARTEVAQAEAQLKRTENLSPEANRELDQFREKAKSAHEKLRNISEKMQKTAFDRQAKQIEKLANDEVAKAREAANMIPLTDDKKERIEKAQDAKKQVEQALKEIAEISKSLKDSQPEVQMVAKLNDLASNQRQLARESEERAQQAQKSQQSQKALTEQEQKKLAQDFAKWQQQQKKVQNELGDILKENEAALKDVLKQQQKKAEQLAEMAQELAQEQEQVEQATKQAATDNAQEALRKQLLSNLAKEQESIAKDTKNLDEQLNPENKQAAADKMADKAADKASDNKTDNKKTAQAEADAAADQKAKGEQKKAAADQAPKLDEAINRTAEAAQALKKENLEQAMKAAAEAAKELQKARDSEMAQLQKEQSAQDPGQQNQAAQDAMDKKASDKSDEAAQQVAQNKNAKDAKQSPQDQAAPKEGEKNQNNKGENDAKKMADNHPEQNTPPSPTAQKLEQLKNRQESIKKQLDSIQSGDLEEALTMQEEQVAQQAEQLAQETDALENDTQMAKQAQAQSRARQAESILKAAKAQADRASQQLTQAKQAQERAEQIQRQQKKDPTKTPLSAQNKQALAQSQNSQKQAENSFKEAAKQLQLTAKDLAKQVKKLSSEKMKSETLESKELAESFQDVAKASASKNDQQASDKAKKAADSLQQLAQAALEKLAGQQQPQQAEPDGSQKSDPRESESEGKQELSEGGKTPDMDGSGVPPELAKLGITFADWARMKGTLQGGSSQQGGEAIPEEYRDLVQRYFRVIAAEAVKNDK